MAGTLRSTARLSPTRAGLRCAVALVLLAGLGCSYGITVRHVSSPNLLDAWRASVVGADEVSPRSLQTLRRWDLDQEYQKHPVETYTKLQVAAVQEPDPDLLFALAEISYHLGRDAEKRGSPGACGYYYLCAGYAYHYLFPPGSRGAPDNGPPAPELRPVGCGNSTFEAFAFDPRFRLACDLYNAGLAKCIRAAQRVGRLDPRQQLRLPTPDGEGFTLSVVHHGFPWQPEEFGPLLFSADYEVVGLDNHYRGYGLGVALIGIRNGSPPSATGGPGQHGLKYPHETSFPVSAFFRFDGGLAQLGTRRAGRLELYNPLAVQAVHIDHRTVPLETDLTTPLAYFLSRTDLDGIEYTGFLEADKIKDRTGLYAFEPYQPGKIPVIMVHGLLASPLTWTTMFNDLRADPWLRQHFQFWFYLYPTGEPFLATAADLRRDLTRLRTTLDPNGRDPALDHAVLVGHSMGGLVGRLLTVESGDAFWRLVSNRPLESLPVHADTRQELHRLFFFDAQPGIERVVFLATPHHGSRLSPLPPGRILARLVGLPKRLMHAAGDVARADPQAALSLQDSHVVNSIDLLAPGSPALELMAARPRPRAVHYHSIIGTAYGEGADASDGIVPYRSAHLDGVDSEVTVPASHMLVHHHPRSVMEVRNILLEHLRQVEQTGVVPAVLPVPAKEN